MRVDYSKFYDLESYLFTEVTARFERDGLVNPLDFYLILVWKANRVARGQRDRLARKAGSFRKAVAEISKCIRDNQDAPKEQMRALLQDWGFRWPTATAVLSVLYPSEFSVYDVRVCEQLQELGHFDFTPLSYRKFTDNSWQQYQAFIEAVRNAQRFPRTFNLRDKDRYLWGRSRYAAWCEMIESA